MKALSTKTSALRLALLAAVVAGPAVLLASCTDLGEQPFSAVEAGEFFQTDAEVTAALAPVYAQLRATLWAYHNLTQVSSDESIVPTRGSDWQDDGRWLAMHRHNWDPNLTDLNDAWVAAYTGIARANGLLQNLETVEVADKDLISAEIRALRAFYYYQLLDLFGSVPIVGDEPGEYLADPDNPPPSESRQAVYDFVVSELDAVREILPPTASAFGRMTSGAADAVLANLYLNAAVFQNTSTGISSDGDNSYNSCQTAGTCQAAIDAVDRILASPANYMLVDDWRSNFTPDNEAHPEHIFVVQHLAVAGLGVNFAMRYMHYNQFTPSPWNGFSTIAETYNAFPDTDQRKDIFLVGQQFNFQTGEPVTDRNGNPLVFTEECDDIMEGDVSNVSESACVRVAKFSPDPDADGGDGHNTDYAFFRLAEMYLIKAEALNEMGDVGGAIALINELRERVFEADTDGDGEPDAELSDFLLDSGDYNQASLRDHILDERLYELIYEAKRRQDLIRYGRFDDAWEFKTVTGEGHRVLFPIPQLQRDANPNLCQNPGYGGSDVCT